MATFGKVNDPEKSRSLGRLSLGRKCCKFQLWSTPKPRSTNTFSQPQFWAPLSMLARNLFAVFNSLQAPVTIYDSATLPIMCQFLSLQDVEMLQVLLFQQHWQTQHLPHPRSCISGRHRKCLAAPTEILRTRQNPGNFCSEGALDA